MFDSYPHFKKGDCVRVTRWWKRGENGIPFGFLDQKYAEVHIVGKVGRIREICTSSYCVMYSKDICGGVIYVPFFALEKVAKPETKNG